MSDKYYRFCKSHNFILKLNQELILLQKYIHSFFIKNLQISPQP